MIKKLFKWLEKNSCIECEYYCKENNVCQSKKCATYGCNPYVNWFDKHFCKPYKAENEDME